MRKALIIILCALGLIVGVIVGDQMAGTALNWLSLGGSIGLQNPLSLDLGVIELTLGFWCKINIGGVIGLVLFAILSKWITSWLKI
ncbi:MAG: DUF4321 domain-containing protein [Clostridia bacterium]